MARRTKAKRPYVKRHPRWQKWSKATHTTPTTLKGDKECVADTAPPPNPIPPFLAPVATRRFKSTLNISSDILSDIERCVERVENVTLRAGGAVAAREPFERRSPRNAIHHLNHINDFASTLSHRLEQALDTIEQLL